MNTPIDFQSIADQADAAARAVAEQAPIIRALLYRALADGPMTAAELAAKVNAHPGMVGPLLEGLVASHDIDTDGDGLFWVTQIGSAA